MTKPSIAGEDRPTSELFDDRYLILRELGRGGMGAVYAAFDLQQMRRVALKRIEPRCGPISRMYEERFHREVRALAAIKHPGIPALYYNGRSGGADGAAFFTMEIVVGERLKDLLARGRLEPERALGLGIELGRILAAAHDAGVLHRDVKPANVLIEPGDRVRLIDFGACAFLPHFFMREEVVTGRVTATVARWVTGHREGVVSIGYSAPEASQDEGETSMRSDIYSLCATLYEMITGRPLLDRQAYRMRAIHADEFVPELAGLAAVLARGAAQEPWDRYASMAELLQNLEIARGQFVRARAARSRRWRPYVHVACQAVVAAGVLILAGRAPGTDPTTPAGRAPAVQPDAPVEQRPGEKVGLDETDVCDPPEPDEAPEAEPAACAPEAGVARDAEAGVALDAEARAHPGRRTPPRPRPSPPLEVREAMHRCARDHGNPDRRRMRVAVRVRADGGVDSVDVGDDGEASLVAACVRERLMRLRHPPGAPRTRVYTYDLKEEL